MILNHNIWYIDQGAHSRSSWKLLRSFFYDFLRKKRKQRSWKHKIGKPNLGQKVKTVCVNEHVHKRIKRRRSERETVWLDSMTPTFLRCEIKMRKKIWNLQKTNENQKRSFFVNWVPGNICSREGPFSTEAVTEAVAEAVGAKQHRDADTRSFFLVFSFFFFFFTSSSSSFRHSRLIYIQIQNESHSTLVLANQPTKKRWRCKKQSQQRRSRARGRPRNRRDLNFPAKISFPRSSNANEQLNESFVLGKIKMNLS